ncbi:hypothetical protein BJV78DRAFT_1157702 [Lactifluus subvellereus]|nr:hypothetical protein BJV78DRAFT_1157702 [Lactifluus subvellereus]
MAPYNRWAQGPLRKYFLTPLIKKVTEEIAAISEWTHEPLPDDLEKTWTAKSMCSHVFAEQISNEQKSLSENGEKDIRKLSKTIPMEVAQFFKNMKDRTGAVFIAFVAFPTEDGDQTYGRYECLIIWLYVDVNHYVDMKQKRLLNKLTAMSCWSSTMMAIPNYLTKFLNSNFIIESCLETVHGCYEKPPLQDPSHMKSDGVNDWLRKGLRQVIHHTCINSGVYVHRCKCKEKARYIEPDGSDTADKADREMDDNQNVDDPPANPAHDPAPTTATGSVTRKSHLAFLTSLSEDLNYQRLIVLLRAAKDGDLLEELPLPWASWASMDRYLSDAFYDTTSSSSLSAFGDWTSTDPITANGNILASYEQVELVILSFGLAFRGLWVAQFPDQYRQVPDHVLDSPYLFSKYEKLSRNIEDLISGYAHVLQDIKEGAQPATSKKEVYNKDFIGAKDIEQSSPDPKAKVPLDSMSHKWYVRTGMPSDMIGKHSPLSGFVLKHVLTEYLSRLPSSVFKVGGKSVMTQIWCCSGRTGIVGLLLCLHWQAEYSGIGPEWKTNLKRVEHIFKAILAHSDLQQANAAVFRVMEFQQGSIVGHNSTLCHHQKAINISPFAYLLVYHTWPRP